LWQIKGIVFRLGDRRLTRSERQHHNHDNVS
jgi:hypothetical protein